jgi:hypothetical protein
MSRQRMTWTDAGVSRHGSEHPATPDEGAASPAHKAEPAADAYASGDTSSWAEDVHPGPYEDSAHPATPDEGPASPAHKAAALEQKAAKCIRLATAMLGEGATVASIENQALVLMDLPDRSIKASIARLAEDADEAIDDDDAAAAEKDLAEEGKSKSASVSERVARLERVLVKLADSEDPDGDDDDSESEDPEGDDDDDGSEDPGDDESKAKKASDDEEEMDDEESKSKSASDDDDDEDESMMDKKASPLERRMDRIERVLHRLAGGADKGDQSKSHEDYADAKDGDKETGDGESAGDQSKSDKDYEGDKKADFDPGHVAPGGWDPGHTEESMLDEMILEEMLAEEGMGHDPAAAESMEDEAMDEPEAMDDIMDVEVMADPMGLGEDVIEEDDMMILASLFGKDASEKDEDKAEKEDHDEGAVADDKDHIEKLEKDEAEDAKDLKDEESKKAALRPQPKKASKGAKTLGGVSKAASSEVGDLSKLWESAPDVSRFF